MSDGSGALGQQGITVVPIGTLDELREQGLDPRETACCHPEQRGVIRGCAMAGKCRFHLPKNGGFKFKPGNQGGMRYVGYRLVTTEGDAKEDFMSCWAFTAVMQDRMDHGVMLRQKGESGESIAIIAQEGEEIVTRISMPKNEMDKTQLAVNHYVKARIKVPSYPRPGEHERVTYDHEIIEREKARLAMEQDFETQAYAAARVRDTGDEEIIDMTGPAAPKPVAVAEPVAKAK